MNLQRFCYVIVTVSISFFKCITLLFITEIKDEYELIENELLMTSHVDPH